MFSPSGVYELFETLGKRGQTPGLIVGGIVGLLIGSWVAWQICRRWLPNVGREKCKVLQEQLRDLADDRMIQQDRLDQLSSDHEIQGRLNAQYAIQIEADKLNLDYVSKERDTLLAEVTTKRIELATGIEALTASERGRTHLLTEMKSLKENAREGWIHPPDPSAAPFVPLHLRRTPIISVVNLKGGVGKTTITANLGVMLAKDSGLRVLMADLDYQGSLTSLCLSPQELQDVRKGHHFVEDVFRTETTDRHRAMARCATRLDGLDVGHAYLLPTEDSLDEVESEEMAPWLLRISNDDIRFRLREALHAQAIRDDYDIVLLDCPPRLSTASVNALAASDYVLIPVLLEPTSSEATPRLLRWIKKFRASFCPELAILGIVANRFTPTSGRPTAAQQSIWDQLKSQCREVWGTEVRFFDEAMIPRFPRLDHPLAALAGVQYEAVMKDLADVIQKELSPYARRRTSAVHPVTHPTAPGVRS